MAAIPENYGTGEGCLCPTGVDNQPSLASALRDIADDIAARSGITEDDASDLATAIALVNAIKAALNTTVKTTKA